MKLKFWIVALTFLTGNLEAQSLADAARAERARRAQIKGTRVYTTQDVRSAEPVSAPAPAPAATTAPVTATKPAEAAPATAVDPAVKQYNDELDQLRTRVKELQDQETAATLEVNQAANQFLSPVSDATAKQIAQTRLGDAQRRQGDVRAQLQQVSRRLQELEAQGPPKK